MKQNRVIFGGIIFGMVVLCVFAFWGYSNSRKQETAESEWVDAELHYIGSAKTEYMRKHWAGMDDDVLWQHTEGELIYICQTYCFLDDYSDYLRENQWYEFYDADFEPQSALEKGGDSQYVFSLGRKLEWLQYNPDKISQFGGIYNRAGKEWEAELEEDTVYFYEFEYSEKRYLADVSMEF
ncbi:MAG: hypothetical protein NC302_04895 [Bacteroidales bacterium]|nr:hypothetical protein [Bacteroidales bacterium]MCM1416359.1 hypothetical protein [bacterium]MCM1422634.1 hypothetical protein [bacterium]